RRLLVPPGRGVALDDDHQFPADGTLAEALHGLLQGRPVALLVKLRQLPRDGDAPRAAGRPAQILQERTDALRRLVDDRGVRGIRDLAEEEGAVAALAGKEAIEGEAVRRQGGGDERGEKGGGPGDRDDLVSRLHRAANQTRPR